jgi:mono/diheme cytochrome c family protein
MIRTHVMRGRGRSIASLGLALGVCIAPLSRVRAQKSAPRSTLSGVYSAEQATRGGDVYAGMCKSCHTAASHTGTTFDKLWSGRSLADLFGYISTKMPKNEPGSLAPEEYVDVLAYLLKLNDMPAGAAELEPDTTALGRIRIESRASAAKPDDR